MECRRVDGLVAIELVLYLTMKSKTFLAFVFLAACPAFVAAQENTGLFTDPGQTRPFPPPAAFSGSDSTTARATGFSRTEDPEVFTPTLSSKRLGIEFLQEEIAPNLRLTLSFYGRIDVPGDTDVTVDHVAYSDIFDIGYGLNVEASLLSWVTPHWAMGGYLSVGWDRFSGASDVDLQTGEFASFDDQDVVTVIVGGKMVHKISPFFFWEGRMGVGLVHYSGLTFSDVTTPVAVSGLQFFRPVNHGLFDLGARAGWGNPRITFDVGLDFRFMGSEARGRDVSNAVDPDFFFVFAIDLGLTLRF
jgi:hypothetical protein